MDGPILLPILTRHSIPLFCPLLFVVSQFVGHYATWLIAPALLGIIPFVLLWQQDFSKQAYDTPLPKLYAFFIALWAVRHSTQHAD